MALRTVCGGSTASLCKNRNSLFSSFFFVHLSLRGENLKKSNKKIHDLCVVAHIPRFERERGREPNQKPPPKTGNHKLAKNNETKRTKARMGGCLTSIHGAPISSCYQAGSHRVFLATTRTHRHIRTWHSGSHLETWYSAEEAVEVRSKRRTVEGERSDMMQSPFQRHTCTAAAAAAAAAM